MTFLLISSTLCRREIILFDGALITFYLGICSIGHMVKDYLVRKQICFCHFFRLAARDLLYAPSHKKLTYTTIFVTPVNKTEEIFIHTCMHIHKYIH